MSFVMDFNCDLGNSSRNKETIINKTSISSLDLNTKFVANTVIRLAKQHNFKIDLKILMKIIIDAEKKYKDDYDNYVFNEKWADIETENGNVCGYESIAPDSWKKGIILNYAPVSTGEIYVIPYSNEFYPYIAFSFFKEYGKHSCVVEKY